MPTLDGARFHSYVRDYTDSHDVPFIFVSGHDDETTRRLIIDPEKDFFFSKTTPIDALVKLIGTLKRRERSPKR
jgi:DNA-binding response OmpR family regulator